MIVSLTTCPLCKSKLEQPIMSTQRHSYDCPTHFSSEVFIPQSHYTIHTDGVNIIQIIRLPPYIIFVNNKEEFNNIYTYGTQNLIMKCKILKLDDSDKLIERIKRLITFS